MLTRNATLSSLAIAYSFITVITLTWSYQVWLASSPIVSAADVKGASTESLITEEEVALTPYPSLKLDTPPSFAAQQYALYDATSGKLVYSSNDTQPRPIASTTKMMTAYIAAQESDPQEIVTISKQATQQIGSVAGLYSGEKISMENLLYALMLISGNDVASAIAEHIGAKTSGSTDFETNVAHFVEKMNQKAVELKLADTYYKDPAGLDDQGKSTAIDQVKLTSQMIKIPLLRTIIGTPKATIFDQTQRYRRDMENSNRLVTTLYYPGSIGGKTGYTPDAGHCLVTAATQNGHTLIAAVYRTHDEIDKSASARVAAQLLDLGFRSIQWQ